MIKEHMNTVLVTRMSSILTIIITLAALLLPFARYTLAADAELIPFITEQTAAEGVERGDDVSKVLDAFGEPNGRLKTGPTEVLYYEQGAVTLKDGKVSVVSLISLAEARAKQQRRKEAIKQRQAAAAKARQARIQKGTKEKKAKAADKEFKKLPPGKRLAYWRSFQKKYPEVPAQAEIAKIEKELEAKKKESEKIEKEDLDAKIKAAEEELQKLRNLRGISRTALIQARRRIFQLEKELENLRSKQAEPAGP